jgi:hypothetical protein
VGSGCGDATSEALIAELRSNANDKAGVSESKAWAAVVLANTAKRFMPDDMRLWGVLDLCSGVLKAHAIATSNWYFAHRHLELDQERRTRLGFLRFSTHALGPQEARLVAGVLGHVTSSRVRADEFLELYATRARKSLEQA